jgi:hypothetical protein
LIEEALALMELHFIMFLSIENRIASIQSIHLYTRSLEKERDYKDRTDQSAYNRDEIKRSNIINVIKRERYTDRGKNTG